MIGFVLSFILLTALASMWLKIITGQLNFNLDATTRRGDR